MVKQASARDRRSGRRTRNGCRLLHVAALFVVLAAAGGLPACSSDDNAPRRGVVIDLPGVKDGVDLDDLSYSRGLRALLVPARDAGLVLIEPGSGRVRAIMGHFSADSADEGGRLIYVTDRTTRRLVVIDPIKRRVLASVATQGRPDYVRYVPGRRELWITIPGNGIEIFRTGTTRRPLPKKSAFVTIAPSAGGPEGLTISTRRRHAYVHLQHGEVAAIDLERRVISDTYDLGCASTHGFPRLDDRRGLLLGGCGSNGEVSLVDLDNGGRQLGRFEAGGGEAVLANSPTTGQFVVRGDPGDALVTLAASRAGLRELRRDRVAPDGHCLASDNRAHIWLCQPHDGAVIRLPHAEG